MSSCLCYLHDDSVRLILVTSILKSQIKTQHVIFFGVFAQMKQTRHKRLHPAEHVVDHKLLCHNQSIMCSFRSMLCSWDFLFVAESTGCIKQVLLKWAQKSHQLFSIRTTQKKLKEQEDQTFYYHQSWLLKLLYVHFWSSRFGLIFRGPTINYCWWRFSVIRSWYL